MAPKVFLSHSAADKDDVQKLRLALSDRGIEAWEDALALRLGDKLADIEKAVKEADAFVLLLSPTSIGSDWVQREVRWALEAMMRNAKYRVIVLLRDLEPPVLNLLFGPAEPLSHRFPRGASIADAVAAMAQALELAPSDLTPPREPGPPPPMAELRIELVDPRIHVDDEGTRRAAGRVRLSYRPAGGGRGESGPFRDFVSPLGPEEATDLRWYVESYPTWPFGVFRDRAKAIEERLPAWGRALLDAIRSKDGSALDPFLDPRAVEGGRVARRITVHADDRGEDAAREAERREAGAMLLGLPWEMLADARGYLFEGAIKARVRRALPSLESMPALALQLPVRVLLVLSRPEEAGVGFIDPRVSAWPLVETLEDLGDRVAFDVLPDGSLKSLRRAIERASKEGRPYHIVHFDGLGVYDRERGLVELCFEDWADVESGAEQRGADLVSAREMGELLRDHRIPLFVLGACQASGAERDVTSSAASEIWRAGVASVVAMLHAVLIETAKLFVKSFYGALVQGDRIGDAMVEAQRALKDAPGRGNFELHDWMVPVLFQEQDDPQLFPRGIDERPAMVEDRRRVEATRRGDLKKPPPHGFVGRARELLRIERLLLRSRVVSVVGTGGQGKTALVAEAARWLLATRRVERAAFVSVERLSEVRQVLDAVGRQLVPGYSVVKEEGAGSAEEQLQRARLPVERVLSERKTMIVVDNLESILPAPGVESAADWEGILRLVGGFSEIGETRVLLTSRESVPEPMAARELRVGGLSRDDAQELLKRVLREKGLEPPREGGAAEALDGLIDAVGGHARSLVLLGPRLAREGIAATGEALRRAMEVLERKHPGEREASLITSVRLSVERLDPAVRERIRPIAVFRRAAHVDVVARVLGCEAAEAQAIGEELSALGLADVEGPYFVLDPALGAAIGVDLDPEARAAAEARWREGMRKLSGVLLDMQHADARIVSRGVAVVLEDLLAALEMTVTEVMAGKGEGKIEDAMDFAVAVEALVAPLGRSRALSRLRRLRERLSERLPASWGRARFLAMLQEVQRHFEQNSWSAALSAAEKLREACEAAGDAYPLAPYDRATAATLLGQVLLQRGRAEEALALQKEALAGFKALAVKTNPYPEENTHAARMVGFVLTELGNALVSRHRYEEAIGVYEEAIRRADERGDIRASAAARCELARVRMFQGRFDEALQSYSIAVQLFEALKEPKNVGVAWGQIGSVHREAGRFEAAEEAYKRSMGIDVDQGNKGGEAASLGQLGVLYEMQGRYEDAAVMLKQAANTFAVCGDALGAWRYWAALADVEKKAGHPKEAAEARAKAREVYRAHRKAGGDPPTGEGSVFDACGQFLRLNDPELARDMRDIVLSADPAKMPPDLRPAVRILDRILDGERNVDLSDPELDPIHAVEIELLLDQLRS